VNAKQESLFLPLVASGLMHVFMFLGFAFVPPAQRPRAELISIGLLELPRLEKQTTKPEPSPPPPPKPKTQKIRYGLGRLEG
jgi:hypothetical protein